MKRAAVPAVIATLVAGGALAVGVPAGAAPAAAVAADDSCHSLAHTPDGGASACFVPHGEHLWVCDTAPDGHHPGVTYSVLNAGDQRGVVHAVSYNLGYGNCKDINLDLPESSTIYFHPVNYEGAKAISTGPQQAVSANG